MATSKERDQPIREMLSCTQGARHRRVYPWISQRQSSKRHAAMNTRYGAMLRTPRDKSIRIAFSTHTRV
jgi:erythromycin esterase-like protein